MGVDAHKESGASSSHPAHSFSPVGQGVGPALIIATRNPAKAARLAQLCEGLAFDLLDGRSFATEPEVDEDAASHMGNAVRKAVAWSRLHQELAIASDGGLVIPALGANWTSLVTRRATGGDVSDEEHAARLLRRMRDFTGEQRQAHWTEAIAVARNGSLVEAWEASGLHGEIAYEYVPPEGGTGGFWVRGLWTTRVGRRHWQLSPADLVGEEDPWEQLAPHVRGLLARLAG